MRDNMVFNRIHLPAYVTVASAFIIILLTPSPLLNLLVALISLGIVINIELLGLSRHGSFDPNPIILETIMLIQVLLHYTGMDKPYIILLAIAASSTIIASSYWEGEGYQAPYTPILPIALFIAPLAGIMVRASSPFLYTLISLLETSILYGIDTWKASGITELAAHLSAAIAVYSILYLATGSGTATLIVSTTYFIKLLASTGVNGSKIYPSIDPLVKILLGGAAG